MRRSNFTISGSLFIIFLMTLSIPGSVFSQEQEFDIQTFHRLKTELWALLAQNRIQSAVVSDKLTEDQIKTLDSIQKVSDYPIYTMTYYGDYGFDEFIKTGHLPGSQIPLSREACSCFGALNKKGNGGIIYGRNLDLTNLYPVLLLYTNPPQGYASVSLHIAIDIELYLDNPTEEHTQWVLEYPFWPFDGMNEYGVAISGLNVPGEVVFDPNKVILSRYEMRRLVLDYARNVDEAIALISKYNCNTSDTVHFLLSDAHGNSAVIEYYDGKVNAHRNAKSWQVATNFMIRGRPQDSILEDCQRYATVYSSLQSHDGNVSPWTGKNILGLVSRYQLPAGDDVFVYTVWSAIYDLIKGGIDVYPGTQWGSKVSFKLKMTNDLDIISAQIQPKQLHPGDAYTATVKTKNLSPRTSKKTFVHFYLSPKKKVTGDSIYLGKKKLRAVNAGKAKTLKLKNRLRADIEAGLYYLIAVVDEQGLNNDPKQKNNTFVWKNQVTITSK